MTTFSPLRAVLLVGMVSACTQHASRPPDEALAPQEWVPTMTSEPVVRARSSESVESRLKTLSDLQKKGLISGEEAKQKRAEILRDL